MGDRNRSASSASRRSGGREDADERQPHGPLRQDAVGHRLEQARHDGDCHPEAMQPPGEVELRLVRRGGETDDRVLDSHLARDGPQVRARVEDRQLGLL
jgi:hypothetical protein